MTAAASRPVIAPATRAAWKKRLQPRKGAIDMRRTGWAWLAVIAALGIVVAEAAAASDED
jgi:hypothetical protein